MFSASLHHTEDFALALRHCAGVIDYQPSSPLGSVIALGDAAFMVASDCEESRRFTVAPESVNHALTLLNQGATPLWLVETASGLQFAASAPASAFVEAPESAPSVQQISAESRLPLSPSPLGVLARKSKHYGGSVLRSGVCSLTFNLRAGEWALVEFLVDSVWISLYQDGALKSRREYPPMSAHQLLKALDFDSILL
jgi:hypothetical protein